MKKKLIISTLALTLAVGVVSCGKNDDTASSEATGSEAQATDSKESSESEKADKTETGEIKLNTNEDDIRALDFYSVEISPEEANIQPFDAMVNDTGFNQLEAPKTGDLVAVIETNKGKIKVKFLPEIAPKAVKNFVEHSLTNYYDNLTFHRVIDDFMMQGGDPTATGTGGESIWGDKFANEISINARHFSGALAMANSSNNVSNGSQFYIVDDLTLADQLLAEFDEIEANPDQVLDEQTGLTAGDLFPKVVIDGYRANGGAPFLDFGYTVFGQVYEGLDVVDTITQVERDENDKPIEDVIIEDIVIGIVK